MGFRAYLRVAADKSQPLDRRATHLVNAVKKFPFLGFHETFLQLHFVTGSSIGNWTPEQIDVATELIGHAYESWSTYRAKAERAPHNAKGQPRYRVRDTFLAWYAKYFDEERTATWRLDVENPLRLDPIKQYSAAAISVRGVAAWLRNLRR